MEREWGNGAQDSMRERKNFISVIPSVCCKTLKNFNFCQKTLKYVTFCREMLRYGTFCRECRKNLNIRAMRKWFWIKSGCEEAPQVVPAWPCLKHWCLFFSHNLAYIFEAASTQFFCVKNCPFLCRYSQFFTPLILHNMFQQSFRDFECKISFPSKKESQFLLKNLIQIGVLRK